MGKKKNIRIITTKDTKLVKKCLRTVSEPVTEVTPELLTLIKVMKDLKANCGVGLAAPQVGVNKQIIIVDNPDRNEKNWVFFNPKITPLTEEQLGAQEGCLSVPGGNFRVSRYTEILLEALDEKFNPIRLIADGLFARIIQHEYDHLQGILICDPK